MYFVHAIIAMIRTCKVSLSLTSKFQNFKEKSTDFIFQLYILNAITSNLQFILVYNTACSNGTDNNKKKAHFKIIVQRKAKRVEKSERESLRPGEKVTRSNRM